MSTKIINWNQRNFLAKRTIYHSRKTTYVFEQMFVGSKIAVMELRKRGFDIAYLENAKVKHDKRYRRPEHYFYKTGRTPWDTFYKWCTPYSDRLQYLQDLYETEHGVYLSKESEEFDKTVDRYYAHLSCSDDMSDEHYYA